MSKQKQTKFSDEDFLSEDLQKKYFGEFNEMPATLPNFVSIPSDQYYFFRGFINFVCDNREKEVKEMKLLVDEIRSVMEINKQLKAELDLITHLKQISIETIDKP